MDQNQITKDDRLCISQFGDDCFKLSSKDNFKKGKNECLNCVKHRNRLYYQTHKENLLQRAKLLSKTKYVPKKKETVEPVESIQNKTE